MNLKYVKGSYMDEIMYEGRPVLFTLDGLEEGHEEEAQQYGEEVWNWGFGAPLPCHRSCAADCEFQEQEMAL